MGSWADGRKDGWERRGGVPAAHKRPASPQWGLSAQQRVILPDHSLSSMVISHERLGKRWIKEPHEH